MDTSSSIVNTSPETQSSFDFEKKNSQIVSEYDNDTSDRSPAHKTESQRVRSNLNNIETPHSEQSASSNVEIDTSNSIEQHRAHLESPEASRLCNTKGTTNSDYLYPNQKADDQKLDEENNKLTNNRTDSDHSPTSIRSQFEKERYRKNIKCLATINIVLGTIVAIVVAVIVILVLQPRNSQPTKPEYHNDSIIDSAAFETRIPTTAMSTSPTEVAAVISDRVRITKSDPEVSLLLDNEQFSRSFYGINYSPSNVQYPSCGVNQRSVTLDMAVLSQLTTRVRIYGTDCDQAALILNAIEDLGIDMKLTLGLWISPMLEVSLRQIEDMKRILHTYPHSLIDSIIVGNELLFRNEMSQDQLIEYIDYVRDYLHSEGIYDIGVGTSEIGSKWTRNLAQHVDIIAVNIHPFFGGVPVEQSTKWTYDFLQQRIQDDIGPVSAKFLISEVGWPSAGGNLNGAEAGISQMQQFLDLWVCKNIDSEVGWYWFEAFDEQWKEIYQGVADQRWETHWGLLHENRTLKEIEIPKCD